jgi:parallel beta-helix repeat protein
MSISFAEQTKPVFGNSIPIHLTDSPITIMSNGTVTGTNSIWRNGDVYTFASDIYNDNPDIHLYFSIERDNIVLNGAGYTFHENINSYGFALRNRKNVTITNLKLAPVDDGIWLYNCTDCKLSKNTMSSIVLNDSSQNIISQNELGNADYWWNPLTLTYSTNNLVTYNNMIGNVGLVSLINSSSNQILSNNFICARDLEFPSDTARFIDQITVPIYRSSYPGMMPSKNTLSANSRGNYWNTYTGNDSDRNGVGDTPYAACDGNIDYYPLMSPVNVTSGEMMVSLQTPTPIPSSSPSPSSTIAPTTEPTLKPTLTPSQQTGFLGTTLPTEYGYAIVAVLVIVIVAGFILVYLKKLKRK